MEVDFAGEGPLRDRFERYADKDKRLNVLGHLNEDDIKSVCMNMIT